jgi:uncharacterized membrane protein
MIHSIVAFFAGFPPEIAAIIIAMLPVIERFALPVAIVGLHLPRLEAFGLVLLGNMVPVVLILFLADKFHAWVSRQSGAMSRAWVNALDHAQKKFARYEKYGLVGLFLFVSLPTPVNGAFTGSIIAFILGYPMRHSLPYLFCGVVVANIIALSLTVGLNRLF